MVGFSVLDWAAWAPGLERREAWEAWAQRPHLPDGDTMPALPEVPPMQRRRIERLGRMAIQAAYWCDAQSDDAVPMLFASRHGDVAKSVALLKTLAAGETLSPTAFGLSVHNAVAASHSIISGGRGNYSAIAGGRGTVESACVEAAGLLADGAPEVRLICYEAPLPDEYGRFADEAEAYYAWCWRIAPSGRDGVQLQLDWSESAASSPAVDGPLPHGLDVHRFLLSGEAALALRDGRAQWNWRRHG